MDGSRQTGWTLIFCLGLGFSALGCASVEQSAKLPRARPIGDGQYWVFDSASSNQVFLPQNPEIQKAETFLPCGDRDFVLKVPGGTCTSVANPDGSPQSVTCTGKDGSLASASCKDGKGSCGTVTLEGSCLPGKKS